MAKPTGPEMITNAPVTGGHTANDPEPKTKIGFLSKGFAPATDQNLIWQDFTVEGTVIPYGAWGQAPYTLTFNPTENGGASASQTVEKAGGTVIDLDPALITAEKTGWEPIGWHRDYDAKTGMKYLIMPNHHEELFALYKKELTVTFVDYDGDMGGPSRFRDLPSERTTLFNKDAAIEDLEPYAQGPLTDSSGDWTAAGWSLSPKANTAPAGAFTVSADQTTYYGLYTRGVTAECLAYGGEPTGDEGPALYARLTGTACANSSNIQEEKEPALMTLPGIPDINKAGYTFDGWMDSAGTKYGADDDVELWADMTFTGVWISTKGSQWEIIKEQPEQYTINGDAMISIRGDSGDLWGKKTNNVNNIFLTDIPTAENYEFQTKLTYKPVIDTTEAAGLIVYFDEDNYLALIRRHLASYGGSRIQVVTELDGVCREDGWIDDKYGEEIYLRIQKVGEVYNGFVSADGQSWDTVMTRENECVTNNRSTEFPTKIGFFSKGFSKNTNQVLIWQDFTVDGTVIPYTAWSPMPYTLKYNAGSGTSGKTTDAVKGGVTVDLNPAEVPAEKTGWRFVGWNRDKDAITALDSFIMPNHNEEVFAIYSRELKVLESPNKTISVAIHLTESGTVTYAVSRLNGETRNSEPMILDSALGFDVIEYADFTSGLVYKPDKTKTNTIDETYDMVSGKFSQYVNKAEEVILTFEKDSKEIQIVFRAYDDGMAFRYVIDGSGSYSGGTASATGEKTEFQLTPGSGVWAMPYVGNYNLNYQDYTFGRLTSLNSKGKSSVGMPVLVKTAEGNWMNIAQGELNSTYCGVKLQSYKSGLLQVALTDAQDDLYYEKDLDDSDDSEYRDDSEYQEDSDYSVRITLPFTSPWRAAVIGTPAEIAETMIFENLCEPCQIADTSWVKPGFTSWSWLANYKQNAFCNQDKEDVHKEYIDLAHEMGWPYYTMDSGWNWGISGDGVINYRPWTGRVIEYAQSKDIGIWVWLHVNNLDNPQKCEAVLESIKSRGIAGIKVDFVWYERQARMKPDKGKQRGSLAHCDWIVELAAKYELMVSFSNAHVSSGERRTYPHVLSFDAVHGAEWYILENSEGEKHGIGNSAQQNTILPFARNATGPMYYSPFVKASWTRDTRAGENGRVTSAHNMALVVLFEAGFENLADEPSVYRDSEYSDFFKNLPSTWDESRILDGVPGEYAVMARRSGDDWYVGAVTDEARTVDLPLSFLGEGSYNAFVCRDSLAEGATDDDVVVDALLITKDDTISLPMRQYGGAAIKITTVAVTYPQTLMSVDACAEETELEQDGMTNAIDGNPQTFWHTPWKADRHATMAHSNTGAPYNKNGVINGHWLQVDLNSVQEVRGIRYLPRPATSTNGNITACTVYVSMDGESWTEAGSVSGWPVAGEKTLTFTEPVTGRYVLMVVSDPASMASCAEFNVEVSRK
ncbi:MAG: glycoside hydrolase family 97 catalytic domain-containing protein [Gracilibacteraceae bacterium]|nr:glycoside hydrolase family 97 catalytic domain-containing protein [Gracilibacteraceae bacterium]